MIYKWLKRFLKFNPSKENEQHLHEVLDDDIAEIEALTQIAESGDFTQLNRSELLAVLARQARVIQQQAFQLDDLDSKHRNDELHLAASDLVIAGEVEDLSVAKQAIATLTVQLEQARSDRERELRRFGQEKAAYELQLLNTGHTKKLKS